MIVSASRRTDIPAFYGRWLANRIDAGFCDVTNPFNPKQISRVSLAPEDVDAVVLWTRYPRSFSPFVPDIISRGFAVAALYTVVDYPELLEPRMPSLDDRIGAFRELAGILGHGAVVWRYDPVILSNLTPADYHLETFDRIAGSLADVTDRVIVSLFHPYRSVVHRLARIATLELADHSEPTTELRPLAARLAEIAARHGMSVQSCADPRIEGVPGIRTGGCIDERLLRAAGYPGPLPGPDPYQRGHCRCLRSRDIGAYETCLFDCAYCYATHDPRRAKAHARRHDPEGSRLLPPAAPSAG